MRTKARKNIVLSMELCELSGAAGPWKGISKASSSTVAPLGQDKRYLSGPGTLPPFSISIKFLLWP